MDIIQIKIRGSVNFTYECRPQRLRKFVKFAELLKEMCLLFSESENGIRKVERPKYKPPSNRNQNGEKRKTEVTQKPKSDIGSPGRSNDNP